MNYIQKTFSDLTHPDEREMLTKSRETRRIMYTVIFIE